MCCRGVTVVVAQEREGRTSPAQSRSTARAVRAQQLRMSELAPSKTREQRGGVARRSGEEKRFVACRDDKHTKGFANHRVVSFMKKEQRHARNDGSRQFRTSARTDDGARSKSDTARGPVPRRPCDARVPRVGDDVERRELVVDDAVRLRARIDAERREQHRALRRWRRVGRAAAAARRRGLVGRAGRWLRGPGVHDRLAAGPQCRPEEQDRAAGEGGSHVGAVGGGGGWRVEG